MSILWNIAFAILFGLVFITLFYGLKDEIEIVGYNFSYNGHQVVCNQASHVLCGVSYYDCDNNMIYECTHGFEVEEIRR